MGSISVIAAFTIATILIFSTLPSSSSSSIYEALKSHGLPMGLLPNGITNFTIDPSTGRFEVRMDKSCDAKFETQVRFDLNFSGVLSYGQIANLSGIAAQDLFLWFPVKGIRVDIPSSGIIYFDVGVVFKQFSLSLFEIPRDCTSEDDDSAPNLIILKDHGDTQIVENESRKLLNQLGKGDARRAVA